MKTHKISRTQFVREGACLAAGAFFSDVFAPQTACAQENRPQCTSQPSGCPGTATAGKSGLTLRPYELLCLVCSLGENQGCPQNAKLAAALEKIRRQPDIPLTLCCNAGDVYSYQDPGTEADTAEGRDYNRKRDFDILLKLDAAPGATQPARIWLAMLLKRISTVAGLCAYSGVTSEAWKGCAKAASGCYERAQKQGLNLLIPPRDEAEMTREKEASIAALKSAKEVTIRPHILVCAVCQYGGGTRPPFKPDNLPELLQMILTERPDVPVKFVRGADWMMCAPCPSRVAATNACVCGAIKSGGLYNELKDLNVLQRLGLNFGSTMKARDLCLLIFEKIPTVTGVCALDIDGLAAQSIWRDGCGGKPHPFYDKGRKALLEKLGGKA
ncbi:MAG: hypothetical protein HZA88_22775 [Verrucomicrobia bacterium]|nr:hypothetical protein [Verrucomicrobiota bacterium]